MTGVKMSQTDGEPNANQTEPEQNKTPRDDNSVVPPDGGYGWIIVFSSFMVSFLVDGVCYTFGIFFPHFLDYFGESKGKTQILGSVINGTYLSFGKIGVFMLCSVYVHNLSQSINMSFV